MVARVAPVGSDPIHMKLRDREATKLDGRGEYPVGAFR
jgi:hypothetical protein